MSSKALSNNGSPLDVDAFDRRVVAEFRILRPSLSQADGTDTISLAYHLLDSDDGVVAEFVERIQWNQLAVSQVVDYQRYAELLAIVCCPSYYKTTAAPKVSVEFAMPKAWTLLLQSLLTHGLGEFAFVNGLDLRQPPELTAFEDWSARVDQVTGDSSLIQGDKDVIDTVLLPVGGGKDSLVSYEVLASAGVRIIPFAVNASTPITRVTDEFDHAIVSPKRTIDPLLLALNNASVRNADRGALNGHVPVTAINSVIAAVTARALGIDSVAFSNERSASFGNFEYLGVMINHQWSKSVEAEVLLSAALSEIALSPVVFSLLRPYSEFAIARKFAQHAKWLPLFTSCNRAFVRDPLRRVDRWCCDCPKCRFVFLLLAPFVGHEAIVKIFGHDLLDDQSQRQGFRELVGVGALKPLECVGEPDECRLALQMLAADSQWSDHDGVRDLVESVARAQLSFVVADTVALAPDFESIPVQLRGALTRYFDAPVAS